MKRLWMSAALALACAWGMTCGVAAEDQPVVVVLEDGSRIEATLMEYGSRVYRLRIGAQIVEIPEDQVHDIQFQRGPAAAKPVRTAQPAGPAAPAIDGSSATGAAIQSALLWLARHQDANGGWRVDGFTDHCVGAACAGSGDEIVTEGATGMALLAFLDAGVTPDSTLEVPDPLDASRRIQYGDVVRRGLDFLVKAQEPDGAFSPKEAFKRMRDDAIATQALVRAFHLTRSEAWDGPARKAVQALCAARNPGAVWRFLPLCGDNDSHMTGWCASALLAAEDAGIEADARVWPAIRTWYETVTDPETGKVGYTSRENAGAKVVTIGARSNEAFQNHETWTAIGMVFRHIGAPASVADEDLSRGRALLVSDLPRWNKTARSIDYGYWYWGTRALAPSDHAAPVPDQVAWTTWGEAAIDALVGHQVRESCAAGSWDADDRWGFEGGRVFAVALNTSTLEWCRRVPPPVESAK